MVDNIKVILLATQLGKKFLEKHGFKHVQLSTADGALEAAPAVSNIYFGLVLLRWRSCFGC